MSKPTSNLPALLPSTSSLLQQTQGTLGLLREVVQESSAEYWYKLGKSSIQKNQLQDAIYAFEQALKINPLHWRAKLHASFIYAYLGTIKKHTRYFLMSYKMSFSSWSNYVGELDLSQWRKLEQIYNEIKLTISKENNTPDINLPLGIILNALQTLGQTRCVDGAWIESRFFDYVKSMRNTHEFDKQTASIYCRLCASHNSFSSQVSWYNRHTIC